MARTPENIDWTPFEHSCGCVIDWGWDSTACPPSSFIACCQGVIRSACPWHGAEGGTVILSPAGEPVAFNDPSGNNPTFYARAAAGESIALGQRLTRELTELEALTSQGSAAVIAAIHPKQKAWFDARGYDPAETWLTQRVTDIVLNQGRDSMPPELLDRIRI